MRIAIANWSRRKVGGVEAYLDGIIPALHRLGHGIALLHEVDQPNNREQITLPYSAPAWCVASVGVEHALAALRDWHPDLIYAHRFEDVELEAEMLKIAPAILFAHDYHRTCISGGKAFKAPIVTPCDRRFAWQCLLHYYPHRCGGLSPVTMLREFRCQSKRLQLSRKYTVILTHSEHMRREYAKHGLIAHSICYPVNAGITSAEYKAAPYWRLLFLGRMDFLKGGHTFLEALPRIGASLDKPLRVTFAGDGPERKSLECQAAKVRAKAQGVDIKFVGWLDDSQRDVLFADCDLLVMPSLWPEPFGQVGPEAGLYGIPVAAFAVGGIPDWLIDGVNGYLAPGNQPTGEGLADAVIKCLSSTGCYMDLRSGAVKMSRRFSIGSHLTVLVDVFKRVADLVQDCDEWARAKATESQRQNTGH